MPPAARPVDPRSLLAAFMQAEDRKDIGGLVALFAPEGVVVDPWGTEHRGPEAIRAVLGQVIPPLRIARVKSMVKPDGWWLINRVVGGPFAEGSRLRDVVQVKDGKIVSLKVEFIE
ncbi:MAG: nuclear transport factor 2 family protein [Euryarchaeota archaeon]|nr:nuclear transport factor 2 family protein [Euryarchaeota archaeon]